MLRFKIASDNITSTVYTKTETDGKFTKIESQLTQSSDGWVFAFNEMSKQSNTDLVALSKYIRIVDGKISLGDSNSGLQLVLTNEQITFEMGVILWLQCQDHVSKLKKQNS